MIHNNVRKCMNIDTCRMHMHKLVYLLPAQCEHDEMTNLPAGHSWQSGPASAFVYPRRL